MTRTTTNKFASVLKIAGIVCALALTGCANVAANSKVSSAEESKTETKEASKDAKKEVKATATPETKEEKKSDTGTKNDTASKKEVSDSKTVKAESKSNSSTSSSSQSKKVVKESTNSSSNSSVKSNIESKNATVSTPSKENKTESKPASNTTAVKPASNTNSSSTNSGSSNSTSTTPKQCEHNWVAITEPTTVTVKEAYTEEIPVYSTRNYSVEICNYCGYETKNGHDMLIHAGNCGYLVDDPVHPGKQIPSGATYRVEERSETIQTGTQTVTHPAETRTENKIVGYQCSKCGAKK